MSVPKRPFSETALARLGAVSLIDHYLSQGYKQADAIEIVAAEPLVTPYDGGRSPSTRTLYRWRARHKQGGIEALENQQRKPLQGSRVFPQTLLDFAVIEHNNDPLASVPELIRRARGRGRIHPELKVNPGSLWRVLHRMGLEFTRRPATVERELRRFAQKERMQCVLVDGKHFRAGVAETKRVVFYFLDDATRRGLAAIVGPSESANLFLTGLHTLIQRFGLPCSLFTDHGSAFVNDTVEQVLARLKVPLINGAVGHPEGRGKIERFNRSVNERVLRTYRGNPAIGTDCQSLSLRLEHDLTHIYNHLSHDSLDGDTPSARWETSTRDLVPISDEALTNAFALPFRRQVSKDNIVQVEGRLLELPKGYAQTCVTLYRRPLENDAIYLSHLGKLIRVHEVQPQLNATTPRAPRQKAETRNTTPVTAASTLAFEADLAPIIGTDGGFQDREDD